MTASTYARVVDGVVQEIIALPGGVTPAQAFVAAIAAQCVACDSSVEQGYLYADGAFSAPSAPPGPTQAQLLAYANNKVVGLLAVSRGYEVAAAGGGAAATVNSDATTATGADLLALNVWGAANPTATQPWVDNSGAVTTLSGAQFQAFGLAVQAYGASVWAMMATAAMGVAAATITTTAEIDALSWPV